MKTFLDFVGVVALLVIGFAALSSLIKAVREESDERDPFRWK